MKTINFCLITFVVLGLKLVSSSDFEEHEKIQKEVKEFVKQLDDFHELYKNEMETIRERAQNDKEFQTFEHGYESLYNRTATFATVILTKLDTIKGVPKSVPGELNRLKGLFEETKVTLNAEFTRLWKEYHDVLDKREKEEL